MGLKPATSIEPYEDLLPELDMVLLMTVEPGFGGQSFLDVVVPKIRRTRELLRGRDGLDVWLQVDGGVDARTIEIAAEAGADVFVAGSAVYGAADPAEAARRLRAQAQTATDAAWSARPPADARRSAPGPARLGRRARRVRYPRQVRAEHVFARPEFGAAADAWAARDPVARHPSGPELSSQWAACRR